MKSLGFWIRVMICFALSLIPLKEFEQIIYSRRLEFKSRGIQKFHSNLFKDFVILTLPSQDFRWLRAKLNPGYSVARSKSQNSLSSIKDLFYWDPWVFKTLLQKLYAQRINAVVVNWHIPCEVMDSDWTATLTPLAQDQRVFWASSFDFEDHYLKPSSLVENGHNTGFNNMFPDRDGQLRRGFLQRQWQPSIALAMTRNLIPLPDLFQYKPDIEYNINFVIQSGTLLSCKLLDVLYSEQTSFCQNLAGRTVILARDLDASSLESLRLQTPIGSLNKAEVTANEIYTLSTGKQLVTLPVAAEILMVAAVILLCALNIVYYPVIISGLSVLGSSIVVLGIAPQAILHFLGIYIPTAHGFLAVLATYLVFTSYRLAYQENLQWRGLKQSQLLRETDELKTNFLSLVSHDLKTPIAKIQATLERIKRDLSSRANEKTEFKEWIDSIETSNQELRGYIESILSLSKIEGQKIIVNKATADINILLEKIIKRLKPIAQHKNVLIQTDLEPLFAFEFDEALMGQVLTNLLDNAVKYSPDGKPVWVRSTELANSKQVSVSIEDQGPGISSSDLPLMFRKFSRFHRPMKELVRGTGLGLYLSKYFIELHGGTIQLESREGEGTKVTFTLPIEEKTRA